MRSIDDVSQGMVSIHASHFWEAMRLTKYPGKSFCSKFQSRLPFLGGDA